MAMNEELRARPDVMIASSSTLQRSRKQLPPLAAPSKTHIVDAQPVPESEPTAATTSTSTNTVDDVAVDEKPKTEQLLLNHVRFARVFKQNDAALLMPFLDKDVTLQTMDGALHEGLSAVLAYLVGSRMTKLSSNLHVKGAPTRSGPWQSKFVYEHGLLFKQTLFTEVIEWKTPNTIGAIAHVLVPGARTSKSFQEFLKAGPLLLTRLSVDVDDSPSNNCRERPSVRERGIDLTDKTDKLSRSNSSSSTSSHSRHSDIGMRENAFVLTQIATSELRPIRKRKTVNPFIVLRCNVTGTSWKSQVARREKQPTWVHIPVEIPANYDHDILEISLWDDGLFRSIKVAAATLVITDLLQDVSEFCTTVELERVDRHDAGSPVQVTLQFRQKIIPEKERGGSFVVSRSSQTSELESSVGLLTSGDILTKDNSFRGTSCFHWLALDTVLSTPTSNSLVLFVRGVMLLVLVWLVMQQLTSFQ